jgi:hypothetical protein
LKRLFKIILPAVLLIVVYESALFADFIVADHMAASEFRAIPLTAILNAKDSLRIAYGHTSHGQQIIEGVRNLDAFITGNGSPVGTYAVDFTGNAGSGVLDICDNTDYYFVTHPPRPFPVARDLGSCWDNSVSYTAWVTDTRNYLNTHPEINVIIWSWCGQAGYNNNDHHIENYLDSMSNLETDYPDVKFVYMTGHVDGTGLTGNLHLNNDIIRNYCITNNKILYDFEDIESWDPDGEYYGDSLVTAACNWDANRNGVTEEMREDTGDWVPPGPLNGDRNWALEWQDAHTLNVDWYQCTINHYHTQHLNDNLKAYAFWWLMARIAGWDGSGIQEEVPQAFNLRQSYPNPFDKKTAISYQLTANGRLTLIIYDLSGREIKKLVDEYQSAGPQSTDWNGTDMKGKRVPSGAYFYQIRGEDGEVSTKKMIFLR